jgi:methanol--5-hydroxybenzimidazolylcobamide Co-methyltransferase
LTQFTKLTISSASDLVFGTAPRPVQCGFDLTIGAGKVFPEVNFTLPAIEVNAANWSEITAHYDQMAKNILKRAVALQVPGIVLEFELLPAMTETPEWGAELTALLHRHLLEAHGKSGLRCALRVTPTDIRESGKPPLLRSGDGWQKLKRYGDIRGIAFALGTLASRDMAWLWDRISEICAGSNAVPGGDTACGFANTAMQLAHQRMLPEVLAAVVRAMSAARSLVAFEHGAVGPSKDCAYEGPMIKAITGCPISMEGKSATCAHFSPMGNIASAMCDLWSNESVQNVRLLSGNAPEAYAESLAYDCRLMNVAADRGQALLLRDWLVESDETLSPQAAVLSPSAVIEIASAIVHADGDYARVVAGGLTAVGILKRAVSAGRLRLSVKEAQWLDRIEAELRTLPSSEDDLLREMSEKYGDLFDRASYGMAVASGSSVATLTPENDSREISLRA